MHVEVVNVDIEAFPWPITVSKSDEGIVVAVRPDADPEEVQRICAEAALL